MNEVNGAVPSSGAGATSGESSGRAALRRTLGTSILAAWRSLGRLLGRGDGAEALDAATIDDALRKLEDVRAALDAMRDGGAKGR